jgi:hypothetical protein
VAGERDDLLVDVAPRVLVDAVDRRPRLEVRPPCAHAHRLHAIVGDRLQVRVPLRLRQPEEVAGVDTEEAVGRRTCGHGAGGQEGDEGGSKDRQGDPTAPKRGSLGGHVPGIDRSAPAWEARPSHLDV